MVSLYSFALLAHHAAEPQNLNCFTQGTSATRPGAMVWNAPRSRLAEGKLIPSDPAGKLAYLPNASLMNQPVDNVVTASPDEVQKFQDRANCHTIKSDKF